MAEKYSFKDMVEIGQIPRRTTATYVAADTSYQVLLSDRSVILTAVADDAYTCTLPPVAKAAGLIIGIHLDARTAGSYTLQDSNDSEDWADATLDVANDGQCVYSDGVKWWVLTNDVA